MEYITISEYGYIGCDSISTNEDKFVGYRELPENLFLELKDYWEHDKETFKIFDLVNKNCLKANSYVGVIQTQNLSIEILPKIYKNNDEEKCRKIFIEMLKPLLNINDIQINEADLSVTKNKNIYEVFITMFVKEMDKLIHKGLRSNYITREDNQYYLKGKLKFNEHIKRNYIHKERFYIEFDEYLQDRVENRLLKTTINLLIKKTTNPENKKALRQQLFVFDEVSLSTAYEIDFKKVNFHRGMEYYILPLRFAEVFLTEKSFTSMRGKDNVFALLFPMEKVFENYIEYLLNNSKKECNIAKVHINGLEKNEYFLSDGQARLEPDFLLELQDKNHTKVVTDAKWKLYGKDDTEVKLSSPDIYQVFSYLTYYNAINTAYLFAPKINSEDKNKCFTFNDNKMILDKHIKLVFVDLFKTIKSHKIENFLLESNIDASA